MVNRSNALHSTGPRTAAGKQRSSLNALSHGLTSRSPILPAEDPAAYQRHCRKFFDEYQPATATETQMVQQLADTSWRINRIPMLEADILGRLEPLDSPTPSPEPPAPSSNAKRLNPIKLKKMQDRCQELEQQIEQVESEIAGYEAELANFVSAEESLRVSNLLEASRAALSKHLAEWEQVSQLVESQQV